ncbi:hypothetical protein LB521_27770 [Mesorhizobium sp. BR-1-1-8]|uniref:hypothetical protein n=1 Tax=Mesorhizobium sp. BR-1-1-8 TaxID=2876659 RepID=UPI001CCAC15E|nr:hypothetical protein [Mesorhizobium sp. BR-1-1-8]MBZ9984936.1 hypothetical protein [Mesorhizobium sp. BR-1-1-8]
MAAYEYAELELKPMLGEDYGARFFAVHDGKIIGYVDGVGVDGSILIRPSWRNFKPKRLPDA